MINPNGSNIPRARALIAEAITMSGSLPDVERRLKEALKCMTRAQAKRRAAAVHVEITEQMRADILMMSEDESYTCADIADLVGLGKQGSGRVSEILHGLR